MKKVLLIGTGFMAKEYAKVLKGMNVPFDVVGRGQKNATLFEKEFEVNTFIGGLDKFIEINDLNNYSHFINGSSIDSLKSTTIALLENGAKKILLEKPGVATSEEIEHLYNESKKYEDATIVLAYNRRFFASVQKAKEIIEEDGGVNSLTFEFTEWAHVIKTYDFSDVILNNWFLGNSTHVVDTAFYLAGKPKEMSSYRKGSLDWHPTGSTYTGSGITDKDALFSYHANWEGPGRWFLEVITPKHRLIFKPFEKLQIQEIGSVQVNEVEVDYSLEQDYKPGLFNQTKAFLNSDYINFCSLEEQRDLINDVYNKISGY
ncbi:putative dehydrogenase [Tenacibaculum skagerrakense]|uniref:Putative dehydrogenase n=1 Tax=Tenacibaculum skagerrakense TaxID=186571 RepID=A0A4R2NMW4_9FLAO|nr:Gfo/Idh/MocA family oxidoreductase [Tenacibaculum skagerrakense]TCP22921.1 putative dehydrogenase [Tenacibaculum skagerrakense]